MRRHVSEKQLFAGMFFLLAGLLLFFQTPVLKTPMQVSEKDLLLTALSLVLLVYGAVRVKGAVHKG